MPEAGAKASPPATPQNLKAEDRQKLTAPVDTICRRAENWQVGKSLRRPPNQLTTTNTATYPQTTSERNGGISVAQWMTSAAGLRAKSGRMFQSPARPSMFPLRERDVMKNQKGFTLIELLIVVAIIG